MNETKTMSTIVYLIGCDNRDTAFNKPIAEYEEKYGCKIVVCQNYGEVPLSTQNNLTKILTPERLIKKQEPHLRPLEEKPNRQQRRKAEREAKKKARN